jgi:hypothetical protein
MYHPGLGLEGAAEGEPVGVITIEDVIEEVRGAGKVEGWAADACDNCLSFAKLPSCWLHVGIGSPMVWVDPVAMPSKFAYVSVAVSKPWRSSLVICCCVLSAAAPRGDHR